MKRTDLRRAARLGALVALRRAVGRASVCEARRNESKNESNDGPPMERTQTTQLGESGWQGRTADGARHNCRRGRSKAHPLLWAAAAAAAAGLVTVRVVTWLAGDLYIQNREQHGEQLRQPLGTERGCGGLQAQRTKSADAEVRRQQPVRGQNTRRNAGKANVRKQQSRRRSESARSNSSN